MAVANPCIGLNSSPSNKPQIRDTNGIKYVTDEAKTGVDICTNLLNNTLASAVPNTDRIMTYKSDILKVSDCSVSELKNPENSRTMNAGIIIGTKFPTPIAKGLTFCKCFFMILTLIAYKIVLKITKPA